MGEDWRQTRFYARIAQDMAVLLLLSDDGPQVVSKCLPVSAKGYKGLLHGVSALTPLVCVQRAADIQQTACAPEKGGKV